MIRLSELQLPLNHQEEDIRQCILRRLKIDDDAMLEYQVFKRAIDARQKHSAIYFKYTIDVKLNPDLIDEAEMLQQYKRDSHVNPTPDTHYDFDFHVTKSRTKQQEIIEAEKADSIDAAKKSASRQKLRPIIIGTGPSGMFAGLALARAGMCPILLERGKDARERARDVMRFWREGALNPKSNVQFGEGGAGTFSDGKLYTQIKDRGNRMRHVLRELVEAGAPSEILINAKPHIGTDKLIRVVRNIRATIESLGGEYRFESPVVDLLLEDGEARGVRLESGEELISDHIMVAIGHSARDTFAMLHDRGVHFEAKPFSIGARIEHPQPLIDRSQYGRFAGHPELGAAEYKLVHHCTNGRTVYSFCMCPGGLVVAASSEAGYLATNGMSTFARDRANANSGFQVDVNPTDFGSEHPLAGVEFQREWEQRAFIVGGENYHAPVQLLGDFLEGRATTELGSIEPSYRPGVTPADLRECLPDYVIEAMREAAPAMDKKLKGFANPEAVLTGVETRSSSPVRITRGTDFQSISTPNLYPAGEGAGYAGGIISAAIDGLKVAEAIVAHSQLDMINQTS